MLIAKATVGGLLTALFMAVTAPAFFMQDAGPGKPDDVAELLPKDTILFAELVRAPKVLHDWKDYIGAVCTEAGKKNVCDEIEKAIKPAIDMIPEKLLKDLEAGLPNLQRLAIAMIPGEHAPGYAVICTTSDEASLRKIMDDLKVFESEEINHQGHTIVVIRKMGEMRFGNGLLVCQVGKRVVFSTDAPSVYSVLDRAVGKGRGEDLRSNRLYKQLSNDVTDDPVIRAFSDMPWDMFDDYGGLGWRAKRASAMQMDEMDAILDFRKIRGTTLEATLKPGAVATKARVHVDASCRLYDAFKQPAGAKETLKFIPPDAMIAAHVNLKGGAELWPKIVEMFKRADTIEGKRRKNQEGRDTLKQFDAEIEREIGVKADDIVALVGKEVAFSMVGEDPFSGEQNAVESLLFVVEVTDAEKAKELIGKITAKIGNYEEKTDGGAAMWLFKQEGQPMPIFALTGKTVLIATKPDVLKAALKSAADGGWFAKTLPEGAAGCSKILGVKHAALWKLLFMITRGGLPDLSKDLKLDRWSTVLLKEEKDFVELTCTDVGVGLNTMGSLVVLPLMILGMGRAYGRTEGEIVQPKAAVVESKPLPADKLAEQVKKNITDLRSDEVATRDAGMQAMRGIGRQASKLLAEACKTETDAEVKGRLIDLLLEWKAYDDLPELAQKKADAFLTEFLKALGSDDPSMRSAFTSWDSSEEQDFYGWSIEPYYVNLGLLDRMRHRDIAEIPAAMKKLAEGLMNEKTPIETRRLIAQVLAFQDSSGAADVILAALQKSDDAAIKPFLQIALGWSSDAKAVEAVVKGFKDASRKISRASFIAADHTKSPAVVSALVDLLKESDPETQWNAAFTLRGLSDNKIWVNSFALDDEVKAQVAAGAAWWEKNKASWKK